MNRSERIPARRGAPAAWGNDAASGGCDSFTPSQPRYPEREWEANYLLPQLVPGAEDPAYPTDPALPSWLSRLVGGLWGLYTGSHLPGRRVTDTLH